MTRFLTAVLAAGLLAPPALAGPYDDLLRNVPPATNTLLLADVRAAFASPLAQKEQWSADAFKRFQSGIAFLPPDAEQLVVASTVNLSSMSRDHQIGLVRVRNAPSARTMADREGGTVSDISGRLVALSPRDVYFTTLDGSTFAAVYPADRQATARWLRHTRDAKAVDLSPYLKEAAEGTAGSMLVIAVDLADVVDPGALRLGLSISPTVVNQKVANIDALVRTVAMARGMTFTVKVTDKVTGTIRVDFTGDPSLFQRTLRDLLMELIESQGVFIPGLESWETTFGPTSMTLTGPMTTADLRRVLSLFAFPGSEGTDYPKTGPSAGATQRYMAAVDQILRDLRATRDSPNYEKMATWHDKAASQIEQLSRQAVDPEAVDAAFESAKRLRAIGLSLRGVPIDVNALERKGYSISTANHGAMVGWWGIRPVWFGGGTTNTNWPQIRAAQAKAIADDQKRRIEAWSQIDQILIGTRRRLQDKYMVPF